MFNPIRLLYFTLFLPRSYHFLSLRTPPWRCGSLVLRWQHLRLDCLFGASSLGWLSEGWHPVGTATSKSRCVCMRVRVGMLDGCYCDVSLSKSLYDTNIYTHTHTWSNSNAHTTYRNVSTPIWSVILSTSKEHADP